MLFKYGHLFLILSYADVKMMIDNRDYCIGMQIAQWLDTYVPRMLRCIRFKCACSYTTLTQTKKLSQNTTMFLALF